MAGLELQWLEDESGLADAHFALAVSRTNPSRFTSCLASQKSFFPEPRPARLCLCLALTSQSLNLSREGLRQGFSV